MHIDGYKFGLIKIDGAAFDADLIIFPDRIKDHWWREQDHRLSPADLEDVFHARPQVLIVGTGAFGRMEVPGSTCREIEKRHIRLIARATADAVDLYNFHIPGNEKVIAAFHLTC